MDFNKLVLEARSCRRFHEDKPVSFEQVVSLVDAARLSPCTANRQSLRYCVSVSPEKNALIFPHLRWAGMLKDWGGPQVGERPTAYIVISNDESLVKNPQVDLGIAAQSIQLAATALGLGCCMLSNINAKLIHEVMQLPAEMPVELVLALGYPNEIRTVDKLEPGQPTAYWRDAQGVHHVPKRGLDDVLLVSFR